MSHPFPQITLRSPGAFLGRATDFNYKIEIGAQLLEILNVKGNLNHIIGSKVIIILLNGWSLPAGGVASGRVCDQRGYPV